MARLAGIAVRTASREPMKELARARVTLESGVEQDFRGRPGPRQVTVIAREDWEAACAELGVELPWTTRRANLLVEGTELPRRAGARLRIGELELEVSFEADPCQRMEAARPGLQRALTPGWRGGVCCRIVGPGTIGIGDEVAVE